MAKCDSCHIWYHHYCMDIPSDVFGDSVRSTGSARGVCECTHQHWQVSTVCDSDFNCLLEVSPRYYQHNRFICRFGVIREEVAIICVRNFLLTEGKVYKSMFIPVLFCLVLMFC